MTTHTNGGWIESIPAVDIELLESGIVRVTDKSDFNQDYSVDLHPMHLRLMAERLGLVRELSASSADMLRDLGRYKRALLAIRDRAEQLHDNIFDLSQRGHEDMGIEVAQSAALSDFADFLCAEFEDQYAPENGVLEDPRKRTASEPGESREVTPSHAPGNAVSVTEALPIGNPAKTQRVSKQQPAQLDFEGDSK